MNRLILVQQNIVHSPDHLNHAQRDVHLRIWQRFPIQPIDFEQSQNSGHMHVPLCSQGGSQIAIVTTEVQRLNSEAGSYRIVLEVSMNSRLHS